MPSLSREPPRNVPILAAVTLGRTGYLFLAGAITAGIGAALLLLAAAWSWPPWADVLLAGGETAGAGGVAERAELLNLPFEDELVRLEFSFRDAAGALHEGRSYHALTDVKKVEPGGAVAVRYLAADPAVAVVEGGRLVPIIALLFLFAAVAALGLLVAGIAARVGRARTRWLARAVAVDGRVLAVSMTREGRGVLVTYKYDAGAGPVERTETTRSYGGVFTDEDAPLVVLCDPQDPARAVAPQLRGVEVRSY